MSDMSDRYDESQLLLGPFKSRRVIQLQAEIDRLNKEFAELNRKQDKLMARLRELLKEE